MDWGNLVYFGIGVAVGVLATLNRSEILAYGGKILRSVKEYREQMSRPNLEGLEVCTVIVTGDHRGREWQLSGIDQLNWCGDTRRVTYTHLSYDRNVTRSEVLEEVAARRLMLVEDSNAAVTLLLHCNDKRSVVLFENLRDRAGQASVVWRDSQESVYHYSQGGFRAGVKFLVVVSEEIVS